MTETHLGVLDLVLLVGSLALSVFIGFYFTNKNKSLDSYMRADGEVAVLPVAVSLMSSCLSGLTLLGSSAELYYQGPGYSFLAVTLMLSGPITAVTMLPVFYRMDELSLYNYLEKRFGSLIKYTVSVIYILEALVHNAITMYMPAMALESVIGVPRFYSILLIGLICIVYSSIGGIKAVIWTDFYQAALMYAAVLVVGVFGTYQAGGLAQTYRLAQDGARLNWDGFLDLNPFTRHTLFAMLTGGILKSVYLTGVNQVQIQRALSLGTLRKAQWAFALSSVFCALISILSTYMGFVIYAAYRSCDPYLNGELPKRDALILHYVAHRMGSLPGVRGVFVAGLISATLSCLSSFVNSMAALALEDFARPLLKRWNGAAGKEMSNGTAIWLSKIFAATFGLICTLLAFGIERTHSRLLQMTQTLTGAICVPFLAAFFLGIFTRYTNSPGVLAGLVVSISLGSYFTVYQSFVAPSLQPSVPVYYNDQCARVFNMTSSPDSLPNVHPAGHLLSPDGLAQSAEEGRSFFSTSYMLFPAIQFLVTVLVASFVSLLTNGWSQQVDESYLVTFMRRKVTDEQMVTSIGYVVKSSDGRRSITDAKLNGSSREHTNSPPL